MTIPTGAVTKLMYINWMLRCRIIMMFRTARVTHMKDEPVSQGMSGGDPLNDPQMRTIVADIARATHSGEETVRSLYADMYAALNRDARIFGFIPLLAAKRVYKLLQEREHRAQ